MKIKLGTGGGNQKSGDTDLGGSAVRWDMESCSWKFESADMSEVAVTNSRDMN